MAGTGPWAEQWATKLASAEDAVRLIPRGHRILIGSGAAEPVRLVEALVAQHAHFSDNEVVHLLTLGPAPYVRPEFQGAFRHLAFFIGANVRAAVQEGRADFIPVFLSEIPGLIRSGRCAIDAALIQVSPPDRHGYVSLGVSVDVVRAAVDSAALVIAQVNPRMPRTAGDSFLHVSRIARLVPGDEALLELSSEPPDDVEKEIGAQVANLVADGATLQVGIGKIPNAVLAALHGRRDLGIHTEMLSDGVMQLEQAGVITGRKKTLLPGKMVTSFIMGTGALYEWAHDHPALELRPSDFTNDPSVVARNDRMISINTALAVDLTGQVAADTLQGRFYSGIGGQVDFVRGASRSNGGRAVIALRSTARKGGVSRIQATFQEGAAVVTSRGDVRYVVTEYGVADLWGKSVRQRAMALIDIAHPQFRPELLAAAKERRYVFGDQVAPRAAPLRVTHWREALPTGRELVVRLLRVSDEPALQRLFYALSDESTYRRFMMYKRAHPHEEMQRLVDLDHDQAMALVACTPDTGEIIAMSRYDLRPATDTAEVAFVVRDDWQGMGVGTVLMRRMAEIAHARGVRGFYAEVLATNQAMLRIFHKSGLTVRSELRGEVYLIDAQLAADAQRKSSVSPSDA